MKKYIISFIIVVIFTYGCSFTTYNINTSLTLDNVTTLVKKHTPNYCNYRGKAGVSIEADQNVSFTILLNKKCNEEVLINVLGALNNPVASIKYEDNKLEVKTQSEENTQAIKEIADNSIFHMISFFKSPVALPKDKSKISFSSSSYIFTDESGDKLYADDKFRIYKYEAGKVVSEYGWDKDEDILNYIKVTSPNGKVTIKFLNKKGWSSKDD